MTTKMIRRSALLALLSVLCALPAQAETVAAPEAPAATNPLAMGGGEGPLEVTALQSLEWHEPEQMYRALGGAKAKRGDVTIMAEDLRAYQRTKPDGKKEVYKFIAHDKVQIATKAQQIFGDEAVYDTDKQSAILTGKDLRFVGPDETVTAHDSLEYWPEKKQAIARGQAVAIRNDRRVEADMLVAQFRDNGKKGLELEKFLAEGHVIITTKTDVARGDHAVYDVVNNKARLSGAVQLTRGASQLAGSAAEVDFKTGISRLVAGDAAGQVRALFVPDANKGEQAIGLPVKSR